MYLFSLHLKIKAKKPTLKVTFIQKGKGKTSNISETSTISVETTEKKGGTTKHFHGDASKVVLNGTGMKKGFMGRPSNFTIDVKNAGNQLFVPLFNQSVCARVSKYEPLFCYWVTICTGYHEVDGPVQ